MNIYELDKLIARCVEVGDTELVGFYSRKREELVKQISKEIAEIIKQNA